MKQTFALLLASLMVVSMLTACGRNRQEQQTNQTPGTTMEDPMIGGEENRDEALPDQNGAHNDGVLDNNTASDHDATNGTANGTTNGTANDSAKSGVSYGQMLRNGQVHDSDGLLNDGENAVSDIARGTKNAVNNMVRGTEQAANNVMR